MKSLTTFLIAIAFSASAHAAIYDFEYAYNGDSFSQINGSASIFGTNLSVGDTLNLSLSAAGNSYWDASGAGKLFTGNLAVSGLGFRSTSGDYSLANDGITLKQRSFNKRNQAFVHVGPNITDFRGVDAFDRWDLSLTLNASTSSYNVITKDFFGYIPRWSLFGADQSKKIEFVKSVPEPRTFILLLLGFFGIFMARRKSR